MGPSWYGVELVQGRVGGAELVQYQVGMGLSWYGAELVWGQVGMGLRWYGAELVQG